MSREASCSLPAAALNSSSEDCLTFWGNSGLFEDLKVSDWSYCISDVTYIACLVYVSCPVRDCDFCFEQETNPGAAQFFSSISGFIPSQLPATTINVKWMPLAKLELPELWVWVYQHASISAAKHEKVKVRDFQGLAERLEMGWFNLNIDTKYKQWTWRMSMYFIFLKNLKNIFFCLKTQQRFSHISNLFQTLKAHYVVSRR